MTNGKRQTVFYLNLNAEPDLKADWLEQLAKAKCSARDLEKIDLPPLEPILGEWLKSPDIGFIYAPRGLGKTWLALHLARRITEGGSVGPWKVHNPSCRSTKSASATPNSPLSYALV